jgi:hypothetical protein
MILSQPIPKLSLWYFLRENPGDLRPLPRRSVDAFSSGDGMLATSGDGYVRLAQVIVRMCDRRAVEVLGVEFVQDRALPSGKLDPDHRREAMASALQLLDAELPSSNGESGVIDARHRFAKRRLDHLTRWDPTDADWSTLRWLVNLRAERALM